eukprot:1755227-Rhodomonas_salina.1
MEVVETDGSSEVGTAVSRGLRKRHATEVVEEELKPLEDCLTCQLCKEILRGNHAYPRLRCAGAFLSSLLDWVEGDMRRNLALGQIIDSLHN